MNAPGESVFAVLTPPGRGGIAVLRCVGPAAEPALASCFRRKAAASPDAPPSRERKLAGTSAPSPGPTAREGQLPAPGTIAYGHILEAGGRPIDEVILFRAGEPEPVSIFEINCHGGPAAVAAIGERLVALGLRETSADALFALEGAGPVERAARRMLHSAASPLAARILLDQLAGALGREIERVVTNLTAPSRDREVAGMPESPGMPAQTSRTPVKESTRELTLAARTDAALARIDALLARWQTCGRFLADPPRIAIAGRPNAGKSTLLNHLVGADRAITSPFPGTTRDTVEATAALEGLPVVLIDTAGLREVSHVAQPPPAVHLPEDSQPRAAEPHSGQAGIEQLGIARARAEWARSAVVIYLVDAREGMQTEDVATLADLGDRAVVAWNKGDAVQVMPEVGPAARVSALTISALTGAGIPALIAAILAKLGWRAAAPGEAVTFTPEQAAALRQARDMLAAGRPAEAGAILGASSGEEASLDRLCRRASSFAYGYGGQVRSRLGGRSGSNRPIF